MTDQELKKMNRLELLEILVKQGRRIEELEKELAETKAQLESREIRLQKAGSIADAALQLTDIFTRAQEAADLYLENVKAHAGEGTVPNAAGSGKQAAEADGSAASGASADSGTVSGAPADEDAEDDSGRVFSRTGLPPQQEDGALKEWEEFPEEPDAAAEPSALSDSGNDTEEPEHWFEDAPETESSSAVKGVYREPDQHENTAPEPRAEYAETEPGPRAEYRETEPEPRAEYRESGPKTAGKRRYYDEYEAEADENGFHWLDDI